MSRTIDERVVEMRFDNKHFESNVQTSMSTLDKLKQKLNLSGASKGLDDLGSAAKRVDLSSVGNAAETVGLRFNAMYSIADQALRNITTSAMNAGTKIIKALTLDPVTTGFKEYETQINAVQTILANTQSKGTTLDDVNAALDELNAYADKTIYNFTEMTRNIGTFTAAGVDLDTSVNAIQGIANLAAVSGSNSQQASTAMYQLSQALSSGTVKLMDWNSVVNAGMGGQVFQDALKETARVHGIAIDDMIASQGSFRETLSEGWLTSEILTETLQKFTLTTEGLTKEQIEANREMLRAKGYTEDQIDEIFKLGETATDAATKVKTFTQLWDVIKEAAQSGWTQTWELIVGDFEQAKSLLTPLSDFLTGIINRFSDWRNDILESALGKSFKGLAERVKGAFDSVKKAIDPVAGAIDTVKGALVDYNTLVDQIIRGEWKNAPTRWQDLAAAGYDWAHAQNLVNERLGSSVRHATNYKEATDGLAKSTDKATESTTKFDKKTANSIANLVALSDAELKLKGFTDEQIAAFRELEKTADKLGLSVRELLLNIDEINGRWLLINSFKNIGQTLVTIFKSIGEAWNDAFGFTKDQAANKIFDFLAGFHRITRKVLNGVKDNADELTRTLKGVFAIFDLLLMIVGGPIKIAFKIITKILGMFNLNILDVTAAIGDVIVKFRNWVEDNNLVMKALEKLVNIVKNVVLAIWELEPVQQAFTAIKNAVTDTTKAIAEGFGHWIDLIDDLVEGVRNGSISFKDALITFGSAVKDAFLEIPLVKTISKWIKAFMALPEVQGYIESFKNAISGFKSSVGSSFSSGFEHIKKTLSEAKEIGKNLIEGLKEGLQNGTIKIKDAIIQLGTFLIDTFKKILGIHSPSTVFIAIGGFIISGLLMGLLSGIPAVGDFFSNLGGTISNMVGKIPWGSIFASGISIGLVYTLSKIAGALGALASPLEGVGDVLAGVGKVLNKSAVGIGRILKNTAKVVKSFSKVMNAFAFSIRAKALKDIAIALAILVGSIVLLTFVDTDKLWDAVKIVAALAGILAILALATNLMSKTATSIGKDGAKVVSANGTLLAIGATLLLLAFTVKIVGSMNPDAAKQGFLGLAGLVGAIAVVVGVYGLLVKGKSAQNIDKAGIMMMKIAGALLLMTMVMKILCGLPYGTDAMEGATKCIIGFVGVVLALTLISWIPAKNLVKVGTMMTKIAGAFLILAITMKIIAGMTWADMGKAAAGIGGLVGIVLLLTLITKIAGDKLIGDIGDTLMKISAAMLILTVTAKIIAGMYWDDMGKAAVGLLGLVGVMAILIALVKSVGNSGPKIAATLLAMSVSIGILAIVALGLSLVSLEGLAKGIIAVGLLATFMALLIRSTKDATDVKGTLMSMAIAIGVMAVAVVALSFIKPEKLAGATIAMSILMGVFALVIKAGSNVQSAMGTLIVMTVAIGVLATALFIIAKLPVEQTLGAAKGLSLLMLSLTAILIILGKIKVSLGNATIGVIGLLALCVPLLAIAGILCMMKNVTNALENAKALTLLATALSLLMLPLSLVGIIYAASGGVAALGIVGLLGMCLPLVAIAGILCMMKNVTNASENANTLVMLVERLGDICLKLAIVGPLALIGAAAMTALTALIIGVGALAVGIGYLMDDNSDIEKFIDTGIPLLVKMASGLGQMIGAFVTGLATELLTVLPAIGTALSDFMVNATPFIEGIKLVDQSVLKGVGIIAAAVLALTAADFISNIASFLSGGMSFATLGLELSAFMIGAQSFIQMSKMIDPAAMEGIKSLASAILVLTGANMIETVTKWLGGGSSLGTFGAQLGQLGTDLKTFVTNLGTFTEEQVTTVNCAGKAIKALADAASAIPNEGGWAAKILGDNSLATFGSKLPQLGLDLRGFITNLGTFTEEQVATVDCAGKAIKALATASQEIPNEGGWASKILGDNSLATFGSKLPQLGADLNGFITNLGVFGEDKIATVNCAGKAIKALADAANSIPNEGGWAAKIVGENSLATFGSKLPGLASDIAGFVTNLGTFGEGQIATVNSAINTIKAIVKLGEIDLSDTSSGLKQLGGKLEGFAKKIASYVKIISEVGGDNISSAISKTEGIIELAKTAAGTNVESLSTFGNSLKKIATEGVKGFVDAFSGEEPKSKVIKAAESMIKTFVKGLNDNKGDVKGKAEEVAKAAAGKLESESITREAKSAGRHLVNGFAEGITEQTWKAEAKATAMAKAAVAAAEEALDINSPSKVFRKIGYSVPEGFAMGIDKLSSMATGSVTSMADKAINGVKNSIARISEYVNSDIDSQPTIRPVLDLSDVRAGAGAINGLFATPSVGVMSNINSISSMMSNRQNGGNTDVVSAINKLRSELGNIGGPSYVINGVNYSDDAGVAEAFETITRAARIERRI